jgi:hypothetical protein
MLLRSPGAGASQSFCGSYLSSSVCCCWCARRALLLACSKDRSRSVQFSLLLLLSHHLLLLYVGSIRFSRRLSPFEPSSIRHNPQGSDQPEPGRRQPRQNRHQKLTQASHGPCRSDEAEAAAAGGLRDLYVARAPHGLWAHLRHCRPGPCCLLLLLLLLLLRCFDDAPPPPAGRRRRPRADAPGRHALRAAAPQPEGSHRRGWRRGRRRWRRQQQ